MSRAVELIAVKVNKWSRTSTMSCWHTFYFYCLAVGSAGGRYCDKDWHSYRLWQATGQESPVCDIRYHESRHYQRLTLKQQLFLILPGQNHRGEWQPGWSILLMWSKTITGKTCPELVQISWEQSSNVHFLGIWESGHLGTARTLLSLETGNTGLLDTTEYT